MLAELSFRGGGGEGGGWGLGDDSMRFWDFSDVTSFPGILSLFIFFFSCVGTKVPPAAKMPWGYLSVKVL